MMIPFLISLTGITVGGTMADWKEKCENEYHLKSNGISMPDSVDWKLVYEKKPLGRNLLKNPAPHGVTHHEPPPEPELSEVPPDYSNAPPPAEPKGDYSGWTKSRGEMFSEDANIPPGAVVCYLPQFSWLTMEQRVDLLAEGLWPELLDDFQPAIAIDDWYEESQIHESIYQLQVRLLGSDGQTVIKEFTSNPREDLENYSHNWKQVSHVFSGYGPGVRYVHFLHRLKNSFMVEFHSTLVTGSSVIVKPSKSS
ncbi:F-box only protein 50 [Alosa sapidissima]|uniref:F-box only protein 50 n=1 Tax=Alosa sapidissima TaxID=34773 RepID=UPI001C094A4D|nr:F-box only protein 50 [Alosa sapidissima]